MGYNQDTEVTLTVPNVETTAAELERFMTSDEVSMYGWVRARNEDELAADYVTDMLVWALGEDSSIETTDEEYPRLGLTGSTYGKVSALEGSVLAILAATGATGTIDYEGEDGAKGRYRLRNGAVAEYDGVVTFPDDPDEADDYLVTWQVNVDAGDESWGAANPTEAAVRAGIMLMGAERLAERMADPNAAVVFDVTDRRTGQTTRIDLSEEGGKCHTCGADTSDYAPDQQTVCAVCADPEGE